MLEQEARSRGVSWDVAWDIAGHGLGARAELWLKRLPASFRSGATSIAIPTLAALSAVLLVMVERGAATMAAPLFVGWLIAFALLVSRRAGAARLLMVLCTATAGLLPLLSSVTGWSRPPLFVLGPLALLSLLGCLATPRLLGMQRRSTSIVTAIVSLAFGLQLCAWAVFAHRGTLPGSYRDTGDMSILAITVQGTVALGLVGVAAGPRRREWLLPLSAVASVLLLFCDPAEPLPALAVLVACWMTTALVLALNGNSASNRPMTTTGQ